VIKRAWGKELNVWELDTQGELCSTLLLPESTNKVIGFILDMNQCMTNHLELGQRTVVCAGGGGPGGWKNKHQSRQNMWIDIQHLQERMSHFLRLAYHREEVADYLESRGVGVDSLAFHLYCPDSRYRTAQVAQPGWCYSRVAGSTQEVPSQIWEVLLMG
jgi:hypothetical protein